MRLVYDIIYWIYYKLYNIYIYRVYFRGCHHVVCVPARLNMYYNILIYFSNLTRVSCQNSKICITIFEYLMEISGIRLLKYLNKLAL